MTSISDNTWQNDPANIIMLKNVSSSNYILELPAGRYRLDAGRRMRTLRSIMNVVQVKQLIDKGDLVIDIRV